MVVEQQQRPLTQRKAFLKERVGVPCLQRPPIFPCCLGDLVPFRLTKLLRRLVTRTIATTLLALGLTGATATVAFAGDGTRIPRSDLDTMFASMRAQAPWNVDGPLLWGYFFLDPSRAKLENAAANLKRSGYHIVDIALARPGLFRLHVEKIEAHTAASLDARNQALYALADRYHIDYDGMDVGRVMAPAKK
jgi:hypothetical protein